MKLNKYLQGYKDGKEETIKSLRQFIDDEAKFIPEIGFSYLLDKLAEITNREEEKIREKIENVKRSRIDRS